MKSTKNDNLYDHNKNNLGDSKLLPNKKLLEFMNTGTISGEKTPEVYIKNNIYDYHDRKSYRHQPQYPPYNPSDIYKLKNREVFGYDYNSSKNSSERTGVKIKNYQQYLRYSKKYVKYKACCVIKRNPYKSHKELPSIAKDENDKQISVVKFNKIRKKCTTRYSRKYWIYGYLLDLQKISNDQKTIQKIANYIIKSSDNKNCDEFDKGLECFMKYKKKGVVKEDYPFVRIFYWKKMPRKTSRSSKKMTVDSTSYVKSCDKIVNELKQYVHKNYVSKLQFEQFVNKQINLKERSTLVMPSEEQENFEQILTENNKSGVNKILVQKIN